MTIRIHSQDLADYVEGMNYNQILLALEGAINTVVSAALNEAQLQSEEEIRSSTLALLCDNADIPELGWDYDSQYDALVNKLAMDLTDDRDNPEVQVLYDEMVLASYVNVINHCYMTPQDILKLTVEFIYVPGDKGNGMPRYEYRSLPPVVANIHVDGLEKYLENRGL